MQEESRQTSEEPSTPDERVAPPSPDPLRRSRVGGTWVGIVVLGAVLLMLIVFIAQNTQSVDVSFLAWDGDFPLAVAVLAAAAGGFLIAATAGTLRIWQLRRRVRRSGQL